MKELVLDEETLKKGWGAVGEYWFSVNSITDFVDVERGGDMSENEFMLSIGYIPFFKVKRAELARAYINVVGSEKLKDKFRNLDDAECIERFWKCYNIYPHLAEGYETFTYNYLIGKAVDWCDEHEIKYVVE